MIETTPAPAAPACGTLGRDDEVIVSFAHGFHDHVTAPTEPHPALWAIGRDETRVGRYAFPVDARDFDELPCPLAGEPPTAGVTLTKRPRFGFTGLVDLGDTLLAGTWNGFYRLDAATLAPREFISNRYTCYVHRFHANRDRIVFVMPFLDLVVTCDHAGRVEDRFFIDRGLRLRRDVPDDTIDWRFIEKPWSGSTGFYHINSVIAVGDELHLLSRHLGAFIVVRPGADRAELRTMNFKTPTCVHDGDYVDGRFHLTSIDGKVLIASEPPAHDPSRYHYDLQVECIRLGAEERNWCRGIAVTPDHMYVTVDGRYGSDLSFGVLQLDRAGAVRDERRFEWTAVGDARDVRFVTGFDVLARPHS